MIRNITKNFVLAKRTHLAPSMTLKTIGFMFRKKSDTGMVFIFNIENKWSFHTLFMRFHLDFIFLDKNKRVTSVVRNIRPWRFFVVGYGMYVVEVPAGMARNTSVGDTISFK